MLLFGSCCVAVRYLQHRPEAVLTRRRGAQSARQFMENNMANRSPDIRNGEAVARASGVEALPSSVTQSPEASSSANSAQQGTPSTPNARAACRHHPAAARLEHTQQRSRRQLPHPCQLSAPSHSLRARTLASALKHNSCQVSPVIARHQQLSRTLCRHARGCQLHRSCRRHDWQPGDSRTSRGRNCDWSS